ncbi:MAG: vWA domain-containing protein [Thermoleophilaceae bacterium]
MVRPEQGVNTMVLDSSGSMRADAGGERKIDAAEEALERLATGTPDRYDLGLVVYGHVGSSAEADKERSCAGVDTAGRLGEVNYRNLSDTLDRYEPRGYTPIARSIEEAGKAFAGREDDVNRVVLVTDGLETCDGDPVAAARRLKESGVRVTVDVVGFDIAQSADAQALRDIAEASGGEYTDARTADELDAFVEAEERRQRELNEAQSCLVSRGNELYTCYTSRSDSAYTQATSRSNAIYIDLTSESNRIYNDLTKEANDASAQGDEERAQEIENRRDQITEEIERRRDTQTEALEGRRDEVTEGIERLRDEAETAIVAEREREEGENARLRAELEREAEEVEQRLEKRYGRASVLETEPYACLPRVFGPLAAALPRPGALLAGPMA